MDASVPSTASIGERFTAGAAGAAVALAVSELLSGLLGSGSTSVEAVGELIIDISPTAVTRFAIQVFGLYDKPALLVGIIMVSLAAGGLLGVLSSRGLWVPVLGFGLLAALGAYAGVLHPDIPGGLAVIIAGVSAAGGVVVFQRLLALSQRKIADGEDEGVAAPERRALLVGIGAVGIFLVASVGIGRTLLGRAKLAAAGRSDVVIPRARATVPPPGTGASLEVPGLTPIVTSNEDFYRIDTALSVPRVRLDDWTVKLSGMVDRPFELTYEELLDLPMQERYVTLCCVSNEVGGDLVGNAKWLGVPLVELLERAGVQEGATQIVGRSVDDFTVGFPTEVAFDGREAMVAVGMNGEPLPFEHGFPARLVVSGLYGYVSATKWLSEIELVPWDAFDAYWIPRGWSKEGPIKTQSRIDLPRTSADLPAGPHRIAGVSWAQNRGITKVEVQFGDGSDTAPWHEAEVSEPLSKDTWVQWVYDWDAQPGNYLVRVRATDASGMTQPPGYTSPRPDGADGQHTIRVSVA